MNRPLFLVGFMGCGKTVVGARVARELGVPFHDSDHRITASEGRTIRQIFRQDGEAVFRDLESRVLEKLCTAGPLVVATGGGAFQSFRSRRRLIESGLTVWLEAPLPLIRERLADDPDRPVWDLDDPVGMGVLFQQRVPAYALARYRVDAADLDAAVQEVVRLTRKR